jgi:hypothetical protein
MAATPLQRLGAGIGAVAAVLGIAAAIASRERAARLGPAEAPRDWTAEWRADPPDVERTPVGLLETAIIPMIEDFYGSDPPRLGDPGPARRGSHVQVMATYSYGVPMDDQAWAVVTRGQTTVVVAPYLRPSLPVEVDAATWRERTVDGWTGVGRGDREVLHRAWAGDLEDRAKYVKRVSLAREASRRSIAEFVDRWLVARDPARKPGAFTAVKVYFLNELDGDLSTELAAATHPSSRRR